MNSVRAYFLLLTIIVPAALFAQIHFTASLDGSQAGTSSTGSGTASLSLNESRTELSYVVTFTGLSGNLSAAGGHFHFGSPGISGPVARAIVAGGTPGSQTFSGSWKSTDATGPMTPAAVESLLNGRVYLNLHTAANPAGEIRGQVNLATSLHFVADITGGGAGTASPGTGTGVFVLNPERTELRYRVTYQGLSGPLSAAGGHIHTGGPGGSGGIDKGIASGGVGASATVKGTWKITDSSEPLTAALVDSLIAGKLYVNFHTAAYPAGEVEGQIQLTGGYGFMAEIEGDQETPPVTTEGTGTASLVLNSARTEVSYHITWTNMSSALSAAGGHFHVAPAGISGPVVRAIASANEAGSRTIAGIWKTTDSQPLTPALVESLFTGRLYVNLHTPAHPAGEVRGQLEMTTGIGFTARLDGGQAGTASSGTGTGSVVLNAERKDVRYSITFFGLSGPLSAAGGHFHFGARGVSGPVVRTIAQGNSPAAQTLVDNWSSSDLTQPLTPAAVDSLIAGRVYANFHTSASPAGEIRGQVEIEGAPVTSVEELTGTTADRFALEQNYPNPFNPSTRIRFQLPRQAEVTMRVFNILGEEVATMLNGEMLQPGAYQIPFSASGLPSGTYFYRLSTSAGTVETKKMLLLK